MSPKSDLTRTIRPVAALIAVALAGLVAGATMFAGAAGNSQPADKMAVGGSDVVIMQTQLVEGRSSQVATLLTGTMKTSGPTDLVLSVTLECALWTDLSVVGNADSQAIASVNVWVEIDGVPVQVSSGDNAEDAGRVTFCDRAYRMETLNFENENQTINTFIETRNANGFNWISLNLGSGTHTIEVKAELDAEVTGMGTAKAAVGKRTIVVDPVKLANNAVI